ncbi:MAG: radical SAM protein [Planctomycetota bacterium]
MMGHAGRGMKLAGWAAAYWLGRTVLRRRRPFIGGVVVNDRCNRRCRQCRVANRGRPDARFGAIRRALASFRRAGIRSVFLEGGEPFLWRDGRRRLEDVVAACRRLGFHAVAVYTNGTRPLVSSADTLLVSLDGLKATNDALRGPTFDRVWDHINESTHEHIVINYTINTVNRGDIAGVCRLVGRSRRVRGVFFNFHTPYYGRDDLFLDLGRRRAVAASLLALKRAGMPIINSAAGLQAVIADDWQRPSDLCRLWAEGQTYTCCRAVGDDERCRDCGYLGYVEMIQLLKLRPSAVLAALRHVSARRHRHD